MAESRGLRTKLPVIAVCNGIFLFAVIAGIAGCATQKEPQVFSKEEIKERKMIEIQKQEDLIASEKEILEKIPEMTAEDYEKLGDNYVQQNNTDMAFIQYHKAVLLDPQKNDIRYKLGRLFLTRGMFDEAMAEFEAIGKNDTRNAFAYEGKGMVFLAKGNLEDAKQSFRKALALNPKMWQLHTFLGIIYDHQEMYDAAISEYRKAIGMHQNSSASYNNLGMSYYLKGDYEKAIKAFRTAVTLPPVNRKIYNNLGLAFGKLGKYDEAEAAFKKGGDNASAYNNIGYVYMNEQKYEQALEAFDKAIQAKPNYYIKAQENREILKTALSKPRGTK